MGFEPASQIPQVPTAQAGYIVALIVWLHSGDAEGQELALIDTRLLKIVGTWATLPNYIKLAIEVFI